METGRRGRMAPGSENDGDSAGPSRDCRNEGHSGLNPVYGFQDGDRPTSTPQIRSAGWYRYRLRFSLHRAIARARNAAINPVACGQRRAVWATVVRLRYRRRWSEVALQEAKPRITRLTRLAGFRRCCSCVVGACSATFRVARVTSADDSPKDPLRTTAFGRPRRSTTTSKC